MFIPTPREQVSKVQHNSFPKITHVRKGEEIIGMGKDGGCSRTPEGDIRKYPRSGIDVLDIARLHKKTQDSGIQTVSYLIPQDDGSYLMEDLSKDGRNIVFSYPDLFMRPQETSLLRRIIASKYLSRKENVGSNFFESFVNMYKRSLDSNLPLIFSSCMLVLGESVATTKLADFEDTLIMRRGRRANDISILDELKKRFIERFILQVLPDWKEPAMKAITSLEAIRRLSIT